MTIQQDVQRLLDLEDIKQLKARYFRLIDTKQWDELATVFAENVDAQYSRSRGSLTSPSAVVEFIRNAVHPVPTVHHGHMPEIEITGDSARGIWAMADMVGREGTDLVMRGYGHYHEEYVRTADGWKIRSLRLTRLRVDNKVNP
jgi:hypothetical protein